MKNLTAYLMPIIAIMLISLSACDKKDPIIEPDPEPVASFTFTNDSCIAPCTVTFTNTSENATSYRWFFDDGSSSTQVNPSHEFTSARTFNVRLSAIGPGGMHADSATVTTRELPYFISFKVDGVQITLTEVSGSRNTTANPRTLTFSGTGDGGTAPKFKFFTTESFIGFVAGLNIQTHSGSSSNTHYTEYTNSSGTLFSSANDNDGVYVFISEISYTNGGDLKGKFSGSLTSAGGTTVDITEGTYSVKFSN